ncbi:DUF2489 domain-containing protein [Colwellia sp. D2M02]|uniref:DUF2489 domain-containing protein n=1 Tax=Colwellia sp. D2M02 TaxID=2841562 RepID=UPI001C0961BD|nr:DUF2489 domain-containing protein [Colwellia sp. D2M02]MBU2893735.1 DUF2489 domain-containing protein [Colwellia sp. D2M02]
MLDFWQYALIAAVVVIAGLAFYAGKLLKQLSVQTAQQQQAKIARQQALNKHDKKVLDSVLLITRAMKEEQCEFDEGCWRISVLLGSLKTHTELEQKFPAIFGLYEKIKTLSILEERKKLPKKERMQQDYQRMKAESELHDNIVIELELLYQFTSEQIEYLSPSA